MKRSNLLLVPAFFLLAPWLNALPVTFNFTLQVIASNSSSIQPNEIVTGHFTVESTTPDIKSSDTTVGEYAGAVLWLDTSLTLPAQLGSSSSSFVQIFANRFANDEYHSSFALDAIGENFGPNQMSSFFFSIGFPSSPVPSSIFTSDTLLFQPLVSFPFLVSNSFAVLEIWGGPSDPSIVRVYATFKDFSIEKDPVASPVPDGGRSLTSLGLAFCFLIGAARRFRLR